MRHDLDSRRLEALATDLADAVNTIGTLDVDNAGLRSPGSRGGPLLPLLERSEEWLRPLEGNAAAELVDVRATRRLVDEAIEVVDEPVTEGFAHGDLIPGNLLVDHGRLTAVIDWGGAGRGDTAQDLAPAWEERWHESSRHIDRHRHVRRGSVVKDDRCVAAEAEVSG